MKLRTQLNQDRYRWLATDESKDERAFALVEIEAPAITSSKEASPTNLVAVLDRSGSMSGERLDHARRALCDIVDRLSARDNFGLVTFDDEVDVVVTAGPVTDRATIRKAIMSVRPGGSTDLAAGLVRGLKEARRLEALEGVRVLLISDGHANRGVTAPEVLGGFAAASTSSVASPRRHSAWVLAMTRASCRRSRNRVRATSTLPRMLTVRPV